MVRWIALVFCSIGWLITGCDGSNCANPNPDYDPTDPTSESCLVACEAGTYRCSQSNLERCKDDGSGYEFVTACHDTQVGSPVGHWTSQRMAFGDRDICPQITWSF